MKSPFSGQSQLEIVQRLIPGIFKDVVRFDSNTRFRCSNEMNLDLLSLDRVPRPHRSNARRGTKGKRGKGRHKRESRTASRMESRLQNDSIVTGKASKKKLRMKNYGAPARDSFQVAQNILPISAAHYCQMRAQQLLEETSVVCARARAGNQFRNDCASLRE